MHKRLIFVRERFPGRLKELSDDVVAYCDAEIEAANQKPSFSSSSKEFREKQMNAATQEEKAKLWKEHQQYRGEMGDAYRTIKQKVEEQKRLIGDKLSRMSREEVTKTSKSEL